MKRIFVILFLALLNQLLLAQQNLPVIKASSAKAYFIEDHNTIKNHWSLDPSIAIDVYKTNKVSRSKWISFHTDIDSLSVKLKSGDKYDFIVLLNGKDSCHTQIVIDQPISKYKKLKAATHDTIPFVLTAANNILFKVFLNEKDTLNLFFDTGATDIILSHETIANKTKLLAGKDKGFKTQNYVRLNALSKLQIGNTTWEGLEIYPVSLSPKGADGHFGWNLFDGRIVELDYDKKIMVIHSSLAKEFIGYTKLDIEYIKTLFCIKGKLVVKGKAYSNRFLFDSGYQRAMLLDSILMKEQNFPRDLPIIKTSNLRNSVGKIFQTKIINNEKIILGGCMAFNIPAQLLNTANPAQFKTHILGNELLKRFNTILDFQNNYVYLKPNSLTNITYVDASK